MELEEKPVIKGSGKGSSPLWKPVLNPMGSFENCGRVPQPNGEPSGHFPINSLPITLRDALEGFNSTPLLALHMGWARSPGQERGSGSVLGFEVHRCLWVWRRAARGRGQASQGKKTASCPALVGKGNSEEEQPWVLSSAFHRLSGVG